MSIPQHQPPLRPITRALLDAGRRALQGLPFDAQLTTPQSPEDYTS